MNAVKSVIVAMLLAAGALSATAHATVVDFNQLAGTNVPGNDFRNSNYTGFDSGSAFNSKGYIFSAAGENLLTGTVYAPSDSGAYAYNGTDYLAALSVVAVSSANAKPFNVTSLDLAPWLDSQGVTQATVTGVKAGGATVSQLIALSAVTNASNHTGNDFQTFVLSGFDNLTSLSINHNGNFYLALDNVVIEPAPIPEPSSLALFGAVLAGCAFLRRRRAA